MNLQMICLPILLLLLLNFVVDCLDNGVGLTPPMGWNSWNYVCID